MPASHVTEPFEIPLSGGASARAFRLESRDELAEVATALGQAGARAGLAIVGGADGMSEADLSRLQSLFDDLAELAQRLRAAVLDGGTDTGVMRLMGRARAAGRREFPLVGVVAERLVDVPGGPGGPDAAPLEPNHTHFVLVPGAAWGDEGPWLADLNLTFGARAATVLVNGGEIARRDAELCVGAGRPLVVLAGSGRTADDLAAAAAGRAADEAAERIAASGLLRPVDVDDRDRLAWTLDEILAGRP